MVEAEIWPNFLWRAKKLGIPVFLANARLSEKSFRGYKRFGFLFAPLFASFAGVGAQNEADAARLREVGCRPETVRVAGNLKFDAAKIYERSALDVSAMLRQIGVPPDAQILVAGSTHDGEEIFLAKLARHLRRQFPKLFLVLVPRHFERCLRELGRELLRTRGEIHFHRSEISANTQNLPKMKLNASSSTRRASCVSSMKRRQLYLSAESLMAVGGQNPIEPGARSKAMIFGPNMQNFADA